MDPTHNTDNSERKESPPARLIEVELGSGKVTADSAHNGVPLDSAEDGSRYDPATIRVSSAFKNLAIYRRKQEESREWLRAHAPHLLEEDATSRVWPDGLPGHGGSHHRGSAFSKPIRFAVNYLKLGLDRTTVSHDQVLENAHKTRWAAPSWFTHSRQAFRDLLVPTGPDADINGSAFNLANSIVGAGILGLGQAYSWFGIAGMIVMLAAMLVVMRYTANLIVRLAHAERLQTYNDLAAVVLGKKAAAVFMTITVVGNLGALIAYTVLIGDFSEAVGAGAGVTVNRQAVQALVMCLIVLPLTLQRELNNLRWVSIVSVVFVLFMVVSVLVDLCSHGTSGDTVRWIRFTIDVPRAAAVSGFAFSCHLSILPVYYSMQDPSPEKFERVSARAFGFCGFLYVAAGLLSYLAVGNAIGGNLLNSYSPTVLWTLVTATFAFSIVFTFPLVAFALRIVLHYLLFGPTTVSTLQHWLETLFSFGVALTVGLLVKEVSFVFSFIGSATIPAVSLIFPCVVFHRCRSDGLVRRPGEGLIAWLVIGLGVVMTVSGIAATSLGIAGIS